MTAPNIVNTLSILGKTVGDQVTNNFTGILTCPTDNVLKISSIICANKDGTNNAEISVQFYDNSKNNAYYIASTITVPSDSTLIVLGKDSSIYLEESDEIRAKSNALDNVDIIVCYEQITD